MGTEEKARAAIGQRLQQARKERRYTQQEVADIFGVNKATVSAWENGNGVPDVLRFARLARLYGKSADLLLFGTEPVRLAKDDPSITEKLLNAETALDALLTLLNLHPHEGGDADLLGVVTFAREFQKLSKETRESWIELVRKEQASEQPAETALTGVVLSDTEKSPKKGRRKALQ